MASLSYAISLTEAINARFNKEIAKAATAPPLTDTEKTESELAKMQAMSALNSTVAIVENALRKLHTPRRKAAKKQSSVTSLLDQQPRRMMASLNPQARKLGAANAHESKANLIYLMSADGMKGPNKSLVDMATSIEPIIKRFDKVLVLPNLKDYNASLNTVPVVGIKSNKIMYIQSKLNPVGTRLTDTWAMFSSLPSDAVVAADSNVFMFPFEGDFCLAIGQKVWRKAHRPDSDVDRAKAIDNWPNLYVDEWKKEGDSVLPSANLRGVVPFSVLSADRRVVDFRLVVLQSDSSLAFLASDSIIDNAVFKPLIFEASSGISAAPKFMRVAYWDDQIVGYDDANNIWNIKVNFTAETFSVADKTPDQPITDLTATETGPVTMRDDGFLYKRVIDVKSNEDLQFKWTKWIAQDGVSHLGVASPGVILDLNLLTRTLRSRYIETQSALYPIVNQMNAFSKSHDHHLNLINKAFDDYASASGSSEKKAIAVKQGKSFVAHAKVWASILSDTTNRTKESVNIMTDQLPDIHKQLKQQLITLNDKLKGLQNALDVHEEAMGHLLAAFWGSVAAMILGVAIIAIGLEIPYVPLLGGALFVAGLASTIAFGKKAAEMAEQIAAIKSQISHVTTAINEMKSVVDSYDDLHEKYDSLNAFWGGMSNSASELMSMDDATAEFIGMSLLEDNSSILAAKEENTKMVDACTKYLETLNKQGIKVPEGSSMRSVSAHMLLNETELQDLGEQNHTIQDPHALFLHHVDEGTKRLRMGDHLGYQAAMDRARVLSFANNASVAELKVKTGLWFDVPALTSNATVWNGFRTIEWKAIISKPISDEQKKLNGSLDESKPFVVSMLQKTVELGRIILQWSSQFPTPPNNGSANASKEAALQKCGAALDSAAKAKNRFSDFQQQATKFEQDREADINGQRDAINGAQASAKAASDNIYIPPELYLSFLSPIAGVIALEAYKAKRRAEIRDDLQREVAELEGTINDLRELQQSGTSFHENALTWIKMCEQVSGNLGGIYNTLTALQGQIFEDPTLYSSLMETEWNSIVEDATAVLDILDVHTPLTISSHLIPSGMFSLARGPAARAAASQPTESELQLVHSLSPDANLAVSLTSQAESASKVFKALNVITQLPYVSGLVAYWDDAKVDRRTLLDIAYQVRNQYVQLVATEYHLILKLHDLSILQERRAFKMADGTLPLKIFVQVSSMSFDDAYESANRTLSEFENSASDLDSTITQVNLNLAYIKQQVDKLGVDISKLDDGRKNMVYAYIADVITSAASSALAFVTGKGMPDPDKKMPASITSTLLEAGKLGLDAATTEDNLKLAIKNLKLAEVMQVIHSLQLVKRDCETTVNQLTAVEPLFHDLVDGLKDASARVMESGKELQKILQNVHVLEQISISAANAKSIGNKWQNVKDATQTWLNTINAQGISPLTFSVQAKTVENSEIGIFQLSGGA